jgi:branched-chain amino acid transport system substrate-binding protein
MRSVPVLALGVMVAAALTAGCGGVALRAQETVGVGVMAPLTSGVPAAARAMVQGATLAGDETGAAGGPAVTLVVVDDRGSAEQAGRLFAELATRGVVAVVGPLTDLTVSAVAPRAERQGVPLISPGATGTIPYAGSSVFRTSLPAPAQARALAEHLVGDRRVRRISIIHEGNDYGTRVALVFAERVRELGGEIVGTRLYRDGDRDFTRHAGGVVADAAEAVLIAGYPDEGALILTTLRELGVQLPVAGTDALYSADLIDWAGAAAEGVIVPAPFVASEPIPAVQEFVGRYRRRYHETPDHYAAQGYDAMKIVAFAIRRGRSPQAVRAVLQGLRRFPGATGEITFDRWGAPDRPVAIARVRNGRFEVVRR